MCATNVTKRVVQRLNVNKATISFISLISCIIQGHNSSITETNSNFLSVACKISTLNYLKTRYFTIIPSKPTKMPDSDSDYVVEEYIKPERVAKPIRNDDSEDLLGNFKDIPKEQKIYGTFPKEVFEENFDHDQKLELLDGE